MPSRQTYGVVPCRWSFTYIYNNYRKMFGRCCPRASDLEEDLSSLFQLCLSVVMLLSNCQILRYKESVGAKPCLGL